MRFYFGDQVAGRRKDVKGARALIFRGRHVGEGELPVQVALITRDGQAFGGMVTLTSSTEDHALNISDLKPVDIVLLPRPYPTFLPYYFRASRQGALDMSEVETLQISIGPGLKPGTSVPIEIGIESVRMEK
ncbi:MAG: hypothetical protein LOY03_10970 [Cyclobacteriaceae bacterium]|nr:hypothetical protein [Cyclobacteriaceae bacterium]